MNRNSWEVLEKLQSGAFLVGGGAQAPSGFGFHDEYIKIYL